MHCPRRQRCGNTPSGPPPSRNRRCAGLPPAMCWCLPCRSMWTACPPIWWGALLQLEADFRETPQKERTAYALVNSGFYEGHQNAHALHMLRHWCRRAGVRWGQGIGAGGGGMLLETQNIPMATGPKSASGRRSKRSRRPSFPADRRKTSISPRISRAFCTGCLRSPSGGRKGGKTAFRNRSSLQRRARDLRPDGRPFRWAKRELADRSGWNGRYGGFSTAHMKHKEEGIHVAI